MQADCCQKTPVQLPRHVTLSALLHSACSTEDEEHNNRYMYCDWDDSHVAILSASSRFNHIITLETHQRSSNKRDISIHSCILRSPTQVCRRKSKSNEKNHIKPSINLGINLCGPLQASRAIQPPSNVERKREKRGCSARAREHVHLPVVVQVKASFRRSSRDCTKKRKQINQVYLDSSSAFLAADMLRAKRARRVESLPFLLMRRQC